VAASGLLGVTAAAALASGWARQRRELIPGPGDGRPRTLGQA
jgi:hypothetical protein